MTSWGLGRAVLGTGVLLATTVLVAGVVAHGQGRPWQSVVFVVLGLSQLGVALAVRAVRIPGGERNPGLGAAVAVSAVLQVAGVAFAPLRELLGTDPLSALDLLWCAAAAAVPAAILIVTRSAGRYRTR